MPLSGAATETHEMETKQIMVALTTGDSPALGNIWRITAKKTDFYFDPLGQAGTVAHLSVHGSNERVDGHRFHIKVVRRLAATAKDRGHFVGHGVPPEGLHLRRPATCRPRVPCSPHPLDMGPSAAPVPGGRRLGPTPRTHRPPIGRTAVESLVAERRMGHWGLFTESGKLTELTTCGAPT
jgi:hypothetical protein